MSDRIAGSQTQTNASAPVVLDGTVAAALLHSAQSAPPHAGQKPKFTVTYLNADKTASICVHVNPKDLSVSILLRSQVQKKQVDKQQQDVTEHRSIKFSYDFFFREVIVILTEGLKYLRCQGEGGEYPVLLNNRQPGGYCACVVPSNMTSGMTIDIR